MVEASAAHEAQNIGNGVVLQVNKLPFNMAKSEHCQKCGIIETKRIKDEPAQYRPHYVQMFAAESIATGLLLFLGCMGCILDVDNPAPVHHLSSLEFGLVILLIIQAFAHISGAHLNPAVTIAAVIMRVLTVKMGFVYISGQFIGAVLGFLLLKVLTPEEYFKEGLCMTLPHQLISPIQAFAIEAIITSVLIFVVCAVWDERNVKNTDSTPIRFAFVVVAISMVAGPFTGASMNTARTFAPAVVLADFRHQWIYWIAPNIGAVVGCGLYKFLFSVPEEEPLPEEEKFSLEDVRPEKS